MFLSSYDRPASLRKERQKMQNTERWIKLSAAAAAVASVFGMTAPILADETDDAPSADAPVKYAKTITTDASGTADSGAGGNASFTIKGNPNQSLKGKAFAVYQLFTAQNSADGASIRYNWNPAYKTAIQTVVAAGLSKDGTTVAPADVTEDRAIAYISSLKETGQTYPEGATSEQPLQPNQSAFRYFIQSLKDELIKEGATADLKVDVDGTSDSNSITISALQYGYYLVDELYENVAQGTAASLCMVDTANPTATINIKSDYPTPDKSTFEDSAPDKPTNLGDYEIGQTVPFTVTAKVPNISGYKTYPMIFRDRMSKGLTLNPDSIKVQIVSADGSKTVDLEKGTDWTFADSGTGPGIGTNQNNVQLGVNASQNDLFIFDVTVNDLKAIVAKNFPDANDTYGQTIKVSYSATLNDKAVVGNPGNPNTVNILFYNNPESIGEGSPITESPSTSTVTFTFGMDNTKMNSNNQVLEGAKFRLYLDKACTKELYVKASTQADKPGYIVINPDSYAEGTTPEGAVEMVSGKDGKFNIYGLDTNTTYWLKETAAPEGYRPLAGPIEFTIKATYSEDKDIAGAGASQVDGTADMPIKIEGVQIPAVVPGFDNGLITDNTIDLGILNKDPATGTGVLPVVNTVGTQLPITGTPMVLLGGLLTVGLVGGGLLVMRKGKKDEK